MAKATISNISPQEVRHEEPRSHSFGLIIFGASGDLTKRKLIPALFRLMSADRLPPRWFVAGIGRTPMDDEEFRKGVRESIERFAEIEAVPEKLWADFSRRFHFISGDSQDPAYFSHLARRLAELEKEHQAEGNRLFYLATPPDLYSGIIRHLGEAGLNRTVEGARWTRIVIEKPFGSDLASARALNQQVSQVFQENQVYRIDHYLGKETVQNILFFRFANAIFEPIWNRRYIDHIQITVAEDIGIEHRAGFYEGAGALRDMFQNHLLQLFCLVTMEPPASFEPEIVRDEKTKAIRSVRPFAADHIDQFAVRGQYGPGGEGPGTVIGYRQESGVKPDSHTETFAALKLYVDNWRWQGVRFYLRSGKRLPKRVAEIAVEFKWVPHLMFKPLIGESIEPNTLVFRIQPDEGISLTFQSKHPGPRLCMDTVTMEFNYRGKFKDKSPEAYERLLLDCLIGDQMLFARRDWVELSWALLTPVLDRWRDKPEPGFPNYPAGTWGPPEADRLIAQDKRNWRSI